MSPRQIGDAAGAAHEIQAVDSAPIRLGIHDTSNFEWVVLIPFPGTGTGKYEIEAALEVPSAGRLNPWEQLHTLTRLDSTKGALSEDPTVDSLRHAAVRLTHMLARAQGGFARHCGMVQIAPDVLGGDPVSYLTMWLDAALRAVQETRLRLTIPLESDSPDIVRERTLIDEFASVRVLEMLGEATSAAADLDPCVAGFEQVRARTAQAAHDEFAYRKRRGFPVAIASSPPSLERCVIRAGILKRHFEEVLFLDRETNQLDERVQQWVVTIVAMLAGVVAFLFIGLVRQKLSAVSQIVGLLALATTVEVVYTMRERIKDFVRAWLAGKVYRFHAQRVSRYRMPEQRFGTREVIVRAREWCTHAMRSQPDPLNPEVGASLQTTRVHYLHKGVIGHDEGLARAGVVSVHHIFRYDFTPMLARLHEEVKVEPMQAVQDDRGVIFIDAPRRYYVPVSVRVSYDDRIDERHATVVVDKRGVERVDLHDGATNL